MTITLNANWPAGLDPNLTIFVTTIVILGLAGIGWAMVGAAATTLFGNRRNSENNSENSSEENENDEGDDDTSEWDRSVDEQPVATSMLVRLAEASHDAEVADVDTDTRFRRSSSYVTMLLGREHIMSLWTAYHTEGAGPILQTAQGCFVLFDNREAARVARFVTTGKCSQRWLTCEDSDIEDNQDPEK